MSVGNVNGNARYAYNAAELQNALAAKGLQSSQIEEVLKEIDSGSLATLHSLGLTGYVTPSGGSTLPPGDINPAAFTSSLEKLGELNFMDIMIVLNEAAKQLREANREMRHAERDAAMQESMNAADKIRSSAMLNLCFGVVSGAINIGMGLASIGVAAKQLHGMKSPASQMKSAQIEMNQVKANADLGTSQAKLNGANADMDAIKLQEAKITQLEADLAADPAPTDAMRQELAAAKADLATQQSALEAKLGLPEGSMNTPEQRTAALEGKVNQMRAEVKGLAAKAEKTNDAQMKSLESDIKSTKAEIAKLEGKTDPASQAKAQSLKNDLAGMEAKMEGCKANAGMYKNPTDPQNLAAGEQLARDSNAMLQPDGVTGFRYNQAKIAFDNTMARAQTVSAMAQGLNTGAGGLGQVTKSVGDFAATTEQAEQMEHTAMSQKHASGESEAADFQKGFQDLMQQALSLLKECLQAQNQANRSIYQNM